MKSPNRQVGLIGLLAYAGLLAAVILVPGVGHAQSDPATESEGSQGRDVWSATMAVGNNGGLLGYSTFSERAAGALTVDSFSWRDTTHTVTNLVHNQSPGDRETWTVLIDFSPPLPEGYEGLSLSLGDTWLNLADARGNNRQFFWYGVGLDWRTASGIPVRLREFPQALEARSFDGLGNNRSHPEFGMAGTNLLRRAPVSYLYARFAAPPPDLPGARFISNIVSAQSESIPNADLATDMVWQWGQFLDHDVSFTPQGAPPERLPIPVPPGDRVFDRFNNGRLTIAFSRSLFNPLTGTGSDNPREQVNRITAFIDASNVYGANARRARSLRANDGAGKLKTSGGGRFLPYNEEGFENEGGNERRDLFLAGDVRANEQVGLTALHTLFVREHNRLAEAIVADNPGLNGQEIFEIARKIVGAQMQVITYNEFLHILLGSGAIGPYGGYDPGVDPTIANEFSTAAYRFGHTMLSPSLLVVSPLGAEQEISLREAFFNPSMLADRGISGFLLGLAKQQAQEVDPLIVDEVRNMLFGEPGGPGRDLAALNIQRGRDHGLPDYNVIRGAYGLPPARTFADVSSDPDVQDRLSEAYGEVQYLDLWTGGLAEDHVSGAMVGETFHTIMVEQFRRLRDGDRYWFENDPYFLANPSLLAEVSATTLADVIRRNTSIDDEISSNVFSVHLPPPRPRIIIAAVDSQIQEGESLTFNLRRTGGTEEALSVNVLIAETGAMSSDPLISRWQVVFGVGDEATTLIVETDDDDELEPDGTLWAVVQDGDGYQLDPAAFLATVTVQDNDGVEIRLDEGWGSFEWPGRERIAPADADISSKIAAVYEWDEDEQTWLVFLPNRENVSSLNTLTVFRQGRTYWAVATEPVTWRVAKGRHGDGATSGELDR